MSEWVNTNPRDWALTFLLLLAWLLYNALRPVKDYYVLQRLYFDRLHQDPWRDDQFSAHYHGFDDFLAAKAVFDLYEAEYIQVLDTARTEAEHNLFMISARSKASAISRLKRGKFILGKELLCKTPYGDILKRRAYWQDEAKAYAAGDSK
jgi:hypothetical protein